MRRLQYRLYLKLTLLRYLLLFYLFERINSFNDDGIIIITFEHLSNAFIGKYSNSDSSKNSIICKFLQLLNEFPHILETFEGMIISIIFDPENANSLIVCKLEFG